MNSHEIEKGMSVLKTRSILIDHTAVSILFVCAIIVFVFAGHLFTEHIQNDAQMVNQAGSLRYRSYKLALLLQDYAVTSDARARNDLYAPLTAEIDAFDSTIRHIASMGRQSLFFPSEERTAGFSAIQRQWASIVKPSLLQRLHNPVVTREAMYGYTLLVHTFVDQLDDYVGRLSRENRDSIERFKLFRIGFVAAIILASAMIVILTYTRLITPLLLLQQASRQIKAGDFTIALPETHPAVEIADLYQIFNQMAASLKGMVADLQSHSDTVLAFNRASNDMVQMTTKEQVYDFICRRAYEILKPEIAWIGLIEKGHRTIRPIAAAGPHKGIVDRISITWDDGPLGHGTSGQAVRTKKPVVATIDAPEIAPWREVFAQHDLRAFISIPLLVREECIGVLAVYSSRTDLLSRQLLDISQVYANHAAAVIEDLNLTEYIIFALARAAEANDEDTGNHILRVGEYCAVIARDMGCSPTFVNTIRLQATLHDVGKIHVNPAILKKQGALDAQEWEAMTRHADYGSRIIGDHPILGMAREIALAHHERWDGSGYPFGLKGDQIPLAARIMNIADQYDALRSKRAYKPAFDHETTVTVITEGDGRTRPEHFDPQVLAAFRRVTDQLANIYDHLQ